MRLLLSMIVLISCFWILTTAASESTHPQLLEYLITQNEATRERIHSIHYHFDWNSESIIDSTPPIDIPGFKNGAQRVSIGTGDMIISGECRWSSYITLSTIPESDWNQVDSRRIVLNNRYFAHWPMFTAPNGNAYLREHVSIAEMPESTRNSIEIFSRPDMMRYGIGTGDFTFRQQVLLSPKSKWIVTEEYSSEGGSMFHVRRFDPRMKNQQQPREEFLVDPTKGFLITQRTSYHDTGEVWSRLNVNPRQIAENIWFPAEVSESEYRNPDNKGLLTSQIEFNASVEMVNQRVPESQFELLALGFGNNTLRVFRHALDGKTYQLIYQDGKLMQIHH